MANFDESLESDDAPPPRLRLAEFEIFGLLGGKPISVPFPDPQAGLQPAVVILSGFNGIGKTTILRMIGGMLRLNFDEFRRIPFQVAHLRFSDGSELVVTKTTNERLPLLISYGELTAGLTVDREKDEYTDDERAHVDRIRNAALPAMRGIKYDLIELDRSNLQKRQVPPEFAYDNSGRVVKRQAGDASLTNRVKNFMQDALINHRRFFRTEDAEFLPRLLERLNIASSVPTPEDLRGRVTHILEQVPELQRMGFYVDEEQLQSLTDLLDGRLWSPEQLSLLDTYIELQESTHQTRRLVADRVLEFESIMDDFLIGKTVRVSRRDGLIIKNGPTVLSEYQLSSGEYHFLYMMVSALLCQRSGTVIAIDEPELSLHISWQRKLIRALTRCAAGASPLFIFATHSLAIASEYSDRVKRLSAVD